MGFSAFGLRLGSGRRTAVGVQGSAARKYTYFCVPADPEIVAAEQGHRVAGDLAGEGRAVSPRPLLRPLPCRPPAARGPPQDIPRRQKTQAGRSSKVCRTSRRVLGKAIPTWRLSFPMSTGTR